MGRGAVRFDRAGSIHVAHTAEERISKKELNDAVGIYESNGEEIVRRRGMTRGLAIVGYGKDGPDG